MRRNYRYSIGDIIQNKYSSYEIIEYTKSSRGSSAYICKCSNNHIFTKSQDKISTSCPYCTNRIIEKGINDISTINPKMFDMLVDKEFGYTHCETSQEKTNWICPTCKNIVYDRSPYAVLNAGLNCNSCSDGISYGEKFVSNLLNEIKISYIYQLSAKKMSWCGKYKYDFYIPSKDCIIEVMGLQHYQDTTWGKYDDIHKNDIAKENLARQHVSNYVKLDVRKSSLQYIKQAILRSELDDILELYLYYIPWKELHEKSVSSMLNIVVENYNNGITDINELATVVKLSDGSIVRYLNTANELGLCTYNGIEKRKETLLNNHANNSDRCSRPIKCLNDDKVFKNSRILQDVSEEIYGKKLDYRNIWAVCNGKQETTKKLKFVYIPRAEFNEQKLKVQTWRLAIYSQRNTKRGIFYEHLLR